MSTEHLTDDERATFLIGQAMRRAMTDTAAFPADMRAQAWAAYSLMLDRVLSTEDAQHVTRTTGLIDMSRQWEAYSSARRSGQA